MNPTVAGLVLGSALVHASWNAILKRQRDPEGAVVAMLVVSALATGLVAVAWPWPSRAALGWSVEAGAFEAGYFATLARALSLAPLGPVYTLTRGAALLLVWPTSILLLGERVTASGVVGSVLVAAGLAATGLERDREVREAHRAGFGWALVCAVFIVGYHVGYKRALACEAGAPIVAFVSLATAVVISIARLRAPSRRAVLAAFRHRPGAIVAAGVLASGSFTIFLVALERTGAGAALTLRNTSVLFAQLFGVAMGERPGALKWAGALLVAVGAAAIAWPLG